MKWWQFNNDLGDGTTRALRFRTEEEARIARKKAEDCQYFIGDGDGSPVEMVDTDSPYFFSDVDDLFE